MLSTFYYILGHSVGKHGLTVKSHDGLEWASETIIHLNLITENRAPAIIWRWVSVGDLDI